MHVPRDQDFSSSMNTQLAGVSGGRAPGILYRETIFLQTTQSFLLPFLRLWLLPVGALFQQQAERIYRTLCGKRDLCSAKGKEIKKKKKTQWSLEFFETWELCTTGDQMIFTFFLKKLLFPGDTFTGQSPGIFVVVLRIEFSAMVLWEEKQK